MLHRLKKPRKKRSRSRGRGRLHLVLRVLLHKRNKREVGWTLIKHRRMLMTRLLTLLILTLSLTVLRDE